MGCIINTTTKNLVDYIKMCTTCNVAHILKSYKNIINMLYSTFFALFYIILDSELYLTAFNF